VACRIVLRPHQRLRILVPAMAPTNPPHPNIETVAAHICRVYGLPSASNEPLHARQDPTSAMTPLDNNG
jgi:hypothetical protein